MKHNLAIVLYLIFIIIVIDSSAQVYSSVNVYTLSKDTISGYIVDFDWKVNTNKILFTDSVDGKITEYSTSEIYEFTVSNYNYKSASVVNLYSSRHRDNLRSKEYLKIKKENIFIEVLANGPKSLYALTNTAGVENFYILYEGEYRLLVFEKYYDYDGSNKRVVENTKYKGQLKYFFNDQSQIAEQAEKVGYDRASLIGLFANYYKRIGFEEDIKNVEGFVSAPIKKKRNTVSDFGVYIAYGISNMVFRSDNQDFVNPGETINSNVFFVGFSIDTYAPNMSKYLSF